VALVQASAKLAQTVNTARQNSPDKFRVLEKDRVELDAAASVMSAALAALDKHLKEKLE
jgi:hypothetical protein